MKKITITFLLFITCFSVFAQENEMSNNEIKLNMSNLIGFKWIDVGYERILNEESSIGTSLLFGLDSTSKTLDEYRSFSLTPYYRHFFSDKYAAGFFVEAFTMIHSGKENNKVDDIYKEFTDLAVGISVGAKWVSPRGFVAEVYAGIGRDMLGTNSLEVVGRGGVAVGYRF